jgi:hypothetical protein
MKKLLFIFIVFSFILINCKDIESDTSDTSETTQEGNSQGINSNDENKPLSDTDYVIVTKTGTKFHRSGCSTIKNSKDKTSMTRSTAISKGYTACSVCNP